MLSATWQLVLRTKATVWGWGQCEQPMQPCVLAEERSPSERCPLGCARHTDAAQHAADWSIGSAQSPSDALRALVAEKVCPHDILPTPSGFCKMCQRGCA